VKNQLEENPKTWKTAKEATKDFSENKNNVAEGHENVAKIP